jgi:hypothetical protein
MHYLLFVPLIPQVTASIIKPNIQLQFLTHVGHSYTVLYRDSLTAGTWLPLGSAIPGDGTVKTVPDLLGTRRFYKVQIQ